MTTEQFDWEKYGFKKAERPKPKRDILGRFRSPGSCCICGGELGAFGGNNPEPFMPYTDNGCCGDCNAMFVIPARMKQLEMA